MKPVKNFTLITGGTEGIGFELAKQFAEHGHNLIIVARDETQLAFAKTSLQKRKRHFNYMKRSETKILQSIYWSIMQDREYMVYLKKQKSGESWRSCNSILLL